MKTALIVHKINQLPLLAATILFILLWNINSAIAYTPPVGIPDPGMWGSTHPIDSPAPDTAIKCPNWPTSATTNCYYIDKTHPQATDASNTYGYPNKPRISIPETYAAGNYVEIHGETYDTGGQLIITANGTASEPVWIRGHDADSKPILNRETILKGSYVFLENLEYYRNNDCLGLRSHNGSTLSHAVVRNCKFRGTKQSNNGAAIQIAGGPGCLIDNIVFYNNEIKDMGNNAAIEENDFHGVKPAQYSSYVWILNNSMYDLGGDSVQVGDLTEDSLVWPHHIYIGGNSGWGNFEDGVDIKDAFHVIVSENTFHDMKTGGGIVMHYNPEDIWVINNTVYNIHTQGLATVGSIRTYFIGNLLYNIKHDPAVTGWVAGAYAKGTAILARDCPANADVWIVNNTIWDSDMGISAPGTGTDAGVHLYNNIIAGRSETTGYDIIYILAPIVANSLLDNNLIYNNTNIRIAFGGTTYTSMASFKSGSGKCQSCLSAEPFFVAPGDNNFHIQSISPAKDAGIEHSIYSKFKTTYGIDIQKDIGGTLRPQGSAWDMGAYEELQFSVPIIKKAAPLTSF